MAPLRSIGARSHTQVARELAEHGYPREAGPGVWDIRSPRVPSVAEAAALLRRGLRGSGRNVVLPTLRPDHVPHRGERGRRRGERGAAPQGSDRRPGRRSHPVN